MTRPAPSAPRSAAASARASVRTRQAALLLHALGPADREWLLRQLPEAARLELSALLAELHALGIPADRALLDEVVPSLRDSPAPAPAPLPSSEPPALRHAREVEAVLASLRRADARQVAAVLRGEPARLVAIVLQLSDWPWKDAVLRQLPPHRRPEIEAQLEASAGRDHASGAALREHLLAMLARRLAHPLAVPATSPRWRVWLHRFQAALRGPRSGWWTPISARLARREARP